MFWWICLCVAVHVRMFVSLRAALCLSSSILEAADAEQMLASVSAVERDPDLLDDDAEGDAAAAPGEPDGDEDRRDEDLRMAAAVLEASPDDVRARLGHEDEVPLAVDSILNWELGEELIASGFGHAEPASAEDTIEEHPEAIARHWADAALTSLQALEWAGSERCQSHRDSAENTVALVATAVSTEPGGVTTHVARWMTFNNQTTWEGRFVRVSARQNYRIEYTMPDGKGAVRATHLFWRDHLCHSQHPLHNDPAFAPARGNASICSASLLHDQWYRYGFTCVFHLRQGRSHHAMCVLLTVFPWPVFGCRRRPCTSCTGTVCR